MKQYKKELGKVSVSAEGKWNIDNAYERISIVFDEHTEQAFISKCDVPAGIDLYNREYWMPLNVSGYSDSNIIVLNKKINDSKIESYNLEEAIKSIKSVGRKPGCILVFYNSNSERLDIGGCWEIWQFNDTNIYNWENIKSWQSIYYNYNKFVGWYSNEEHLKKYNPFPEVGCYAYVGSELNNSVVFRCDSKYVWTRTKETAKDYVKVILDGTITVGENGNWYQNGVDTNIPASVKGDDGKTPFIRNINNILEYSYDEIEWKPISEQIAAWFRWKAGDPNKHYIGNIQISRDNISWQNLSGNIVDSLHISKHISVDEQLPTNVAEGTIIAKRTNTTDTISYELFVYAYNEFNVLAWVSHGVFTSISVGLTQETGNNENVVMSQKAVTENLNVINANTGISEYAAFSSAEDYVVGDVVIYDGRLYMFTADHVAGEWIGTDAENTNTLSDLYNTLGYNISSFKLVEGYFHSSRTDQILLTGKSGDSLFVIVETSDRTNEPCEIYGYSEDGTSSVIFVGTTNVLKKITLSTDVIRIGVAIAGYADVEVKFSVLYNEIGQVKQNTQDINALRSTFPYYAYFTNSTAPSFQRINSTTIKVTFSKNNGNEFLRIYKNSGEVLLVHYFTEDESFEIGSFKKLVINKENDTLSVKENSNINESDIILLIYQGIDGCVCDGLLAPYYSKWKDDNVNIEIRGYFTNAKTPNIVYNGNDMSYIVTMPEGELRLYDANGILTEISFDGETYNISSLNSLVYSRLDGSVNIIGSSSKKAYHIVLFETMGASEARGAIADYFYPSYKIYNEKNILFAQRQIYSYFTNAKSPSFNISKTDIIVTLPAEQYMRLYNSKNEKIVETIVPSSNKFIIPLYNSLVYDNTDKEFKIVSFTSTVQKNEMFILLCNKGESSYYGLFSDYYTAFVYEKTKNKQVTIQNAMSNSVNNIIVESGCIIIRKGFSLIIGGTRYAIGCSDDYIIKTLDDIGGTRVTRTFVYINTSVLTTEGNYLDGDSAKDIFVLTSEPNDSEEYILFATFYYQTASGGLIDSYVLYKDKSDVLKLYADKEIEMAQMKFRSDFTFMFFSDIHASKTNLNRIIKLSESWGCGAIINGGDTVSYIITEGLDWYDQIIEEASIDVLTAVGNHDAWLSASDWTWAEASEVYSKVILPTINRVSSIVQPTDAEANSLLSYYKDYGKVRVIVVNGMAVGATKYYWSDIENEWMKSILTDALNNDMAVLCVTHPPLEKEDGNVIDSITFNGWAGYKNDIVDDKQSIRHDILSTIDEALSNVDEFIDAGGNFIGWIAGHTHLDYFLTSISHPKQAMFVTASANYAKGSDYKTMSDVESVMYDCMNMIAVDTTKSWIKILRVGKNIDGFMRKKNVLVWDYHNQKVIANY